MQLSLGDLEEFYKNMNTGIEIEVKLYHIIFTFAVLLISV